MNRVTWKLIAAPAALILCLGAAPVHAQEAAPAEPAPAPAEAPAPAPAPDAAAIAVLQSDAAWDVKAEACRTLRQVGTPAAAPALAALLADDKLSHYARYALEAIPGPEVSAALVAALGTVPTTHQAGIAATLGARRDASAVAPLAALMAGTDDAVAEAAAAALGRIGTQDAARELRRYSKPAPTGRKVAVGEGLLAACQHIVREGNPNFAAEALAALSGTDWPEHIRMGAFEWTVRALPKNAHTQIIAALKGEDAKQRDFAAALVVEVKESPTSRYVSALKGLPPGGQAALIRALGLRGDAAAEPALVAALQNGAPEVRTAAILALGELDTPGAIPALAALLTPVGTPEAAAAREALRVSRAEGVDAALAQAAPSAEPDRCAQLIELLTARMSPEAVTLAKQYLGGASEGLVRLAAWQALAQLGGAEEFSAALGYLPNAAAGEEQTAAAAALGAIAQFNNDAVTPLLLEATAQATPATYPILLQTMGRIGSAPALEAVVTALGNADATVQDAAVGVLEDWPSAEALPHLLTLAQSEVEGRHKSGLRGYVRLARAEADATKKADLLDAAMPLCRVKEDKWVVLAAYGTVWHVRAFDALLAQLADEEVKNEAAAAIVSVATELPKLDANTKPRALEALEAVLGATDRQIILDRATAAKAELTK
jgi:HEAT repeat protein